MYQNRKFNPDDGDVDAGNAAYPKEDSQDATPIQLVGSVYGANRDDLTFKQQGGFLHILTLSTICLIHLRVVSLVSAGASDVACCIFICLFAILAGFLEEK
jgi:hypothetical protein